MRIASSSRLPGPRPTATLELEIPETGQHVRQESQRSLCARGGGQLAEHHQSSIEVVGETQTATEVSLELVGQVAHALGPVGCSADELAAGRKVAREDQRRPEHEPRADPCPGIGLVGQALRPSCQRERINRPTAAQCWDHRVSEEEGRPPRVLSLASISCGDEDLAGGSGGTHASGHAAAEMLDLRSERTSGDIGSGGVQVVERCADVPGEKRGLGGVEEPTSSLLRIGREARGQLEGACSRAVSAPVTRSSRGLGQVGSDRFLRGRSRSCLVPGASVRVRGSA